MVPVGLQDGKKVKEEKKRRRGKEEKERKMQRRGMERSDFSDCTNYTNIQEPVSAECISSRSTNLFPGLFSPVFPPSIFSLSFFPFHLTIPVGFPLVRYVLL